MWEEVLEGDLGAVMVIGGIENSICRFLMEPTPGVESRTAFWVLSLTDDEMLEAAAVAMERDALRWYLWEHKRHPIRRWADLRMFILRQFRSQSEGSLYEQWLATAHTTTVLEYWRRFIEKVATLEGISEDILLGQFINELKEEVKAEVRLLHPISLEQATELAIRVEEKNRVTNGRKMGLSSVKTSSGYSRGMSTVPTYILFWSSQSFNLKALGT